MTQQCPAAGPDASTVLAFDCAVSGLGVTVMRGGTCLTVLREEGREQAARLLPVVAAALSQAGVARREVSLIAATIGPGSFTGVRVGLAAARGLAVGLGVPLAGLATTSVLLAQMSSDGRVPVAAIDSKLGDWFCAIGKEGESGDGPAPFVASADVLAARLRGRACLLIGHEVAPLATALVSAGIDARLHEAPPDVVTLGRLALAGGVDAWRARNARDGLPRPLYLRGVNITLPDGARRTVE